ncbi:SMP-30/gluconolactonase/LRE family protein [Acuticoccus sediminis]|uniref:SMP-30/gluconolactonase/LRE family protein n=1 Tax=Acuticoccus sediminis TaxID=2184697 RepID=UPI001CFD506D|nr:SMP-30/gluconolactonase/LRE family protein [Acuticoccus sediminis]
MIALSAIDFVGHGLDRPECVLTHASGALFAADWAGDGGVAIVSPSGMVRRVTAKRAPEPMRPNGIALEAGGSFLLAHLGPENGGVFRLFADGSLEPVVTEVGGRPLPPTNFVLLDRWGRMWITVSTRMIPRHGAARPDVADGFIVLVPPDGPARVVADDLGYTNECIVSADGRRLCVNETFARRVSRFEIRDDGSLGPRETLAVFGEGTFPDGLAPDVEGNLWITSIVSNRVIRVAPDGTAETLVEDCDRAAVAETEAMFARGELGSARLNLTLGARLANISSLAFGGEDMRRAYLGCLKGDAIATFEMPVAGVEPVHWRADLGPLIEAGLLDTTA